MSSTDYDSPRVLYRLWNSAEPTPLLALPSLAKKCGVAAIFVKDEGWRPLGSFKALGGMYAGLRALVRAVGSPSIEALPAAAKSALPLPALVCASDGNHGLAVAAAARTAGTTARVYLHRHVPESRARRIREQGGEVVWVEGTYDDAVDAAMHAADRGDGLLISDTSANADDLVTADVMNGYGLMADEIAEQLRIRNEMPPTHLFVQAGVGGLAAALARGLHEKWTPACRVTVVEPQRAACVGHALRRGQIERLSGDLQTAAEMLSCGEASAPALEILQRHGATALAVDEPALHAAVELFATNGGPRTTPSGATGLAGLAAALPGTIAGKELGIDERSRILLIVTEGCVPVESAS